MPMAGRHIRHDWQTFVVWEQKSVRTLCNRTSTYNATGIPGVSLQEEIVELGSRKVFGWCTICAHLAFGVSDNVISGRVGPVITEVLNLYGRVWTITQPISEAYLTRQRTLRSVR